MKKLNPKDFSSNYEYEKAKKKVKKNVVNKRTERSKRFNDIYSNTTSVYNDAQEYEPL